MLMHALGKRVVGCGHDVLHNNGKRLLSFATDKLALTNTFFGTRKEGWYIAYAQQHQSE